MEKKKKETVLSNSRVCCFFSFKCKSQFASAVTYNNKPNNNTNCFVFANSLYFTHSVTWSNVALRRTLKRFLVQQKAVDVKLKAAPTPPTGLEDNRQHKILTLTNLMLFVSCLLQYTAYIHMYIHYKY